jgi:hypothetical protein
MFQVQRESRVMLGAPKTSVAPHVLYDLNVAPHVNLIFSTRIKQFGILTITRTKLHE